MYRYLGSGRWNLGRDVVRAFAQAMSGHYRTRVRERRYSYRPSWQTAIRESVPATLVHASGDAAPGS